MKLGVTCSADRRTGQFLLQNSESGIGAMAQFNPRESTLDFMNVFVD